MMIKKATVNEYFHWLENTIDKNSDLYKAIHTYTEKQNNRPKHEGPFLTIITRTQGKRKHMLAEALLCLAGQSNYDFELLIMAHNLDQEKTDEVNQIINDTPQFLREKIRLISVSGGTRTTPLNRGFEEAKGEYIAILDDDDIVFDNWVDEFYKLSKENNGKMLHTYAIRQEWEVVGENNDIPRATGSPENAFCNDFDLRRQLAMNSCPLHSLAFPAYCFKELGIHFDESLSTTEDWDFLMRTSFLTGVANSNTPTCIYRIWKNTENSQSLHNKEEWDNNYKYITKKFTETPIILMPEHYKSILGPSYLHDFSLHSSDNQLFYNDGNGFSVSRMLTGEQYTKEEDYFVAFNFDEEYAEITSLRLDPMELGGFILSDLKMKVVFQNGTEEIYTLKNVTNNGFVLKDNKVAFVKSDPQLIAYLKKPSKIKCVYAGYKLQKPIDDATLGHLLIKRNIILRALSFIKRKTHGLLRRVKYGSK